MRVLVVEDYAPLRLAVIKGLQEAGYAPEGCGDGEEAERCVQTLQHDLIILDLMLPKRDGRDILRAMRERGDDRPVLLLTARDQIPDRIAGLDAGADDYMVKPFDLGEFLARVRALARRSGSSQVLAVADLVLNRPRRIAERAGVVIELTATEFVVLDLLATHAGTVVGREAIRSALYQDSPESANSNVVDVYIGYLRRKIDRPGLQRLIHTRRGHGYLLGPS